MTTLYEQAILRTKRIPVTDYDEHGNEIVTYVSQDTMDLAEQYGPLPKGMADFDESLLPQGWDEPDYEAGNAYRARTASPCTFLPRKGR